MSLSGKYQEKIITNLLSELCYVQQLFYERHILTMDIKKGINVFISHSSKDKKFVNILYAELAFNGYFPWLDEREIKGGESIPRKIQEGLTNSDYVLVILSKNSVKSNWVNEEWETKYWEEVKENRVKVIPILIEECDIPPLLKKKKYIDFRGDYNTALSFLYKSLI